MSDFERIKLYYQKGWASIAQLRQYVVYNKITPAQYEEITGEIY